MNVRANLPFEIYLLILLLALVGLNAFVAGLGLLIFPDGQWIGMNTHWLDGSPFSTFRIPGFLLFLFVGLTSLVSSYGLFFMPDWQWPQRFNIFNNRFWAWTYSLYSGLIFCIWIVVQQLMTDYFILQPIIMGVGILVIILTLLPRVADYYSK